MKKADLEQAILNGLRDCEKRSDALFLPACLAGQVQSLAKGGDKVAQEIYRECCRILGRPEWLEEIGLK